MNVYWKRKHDDINLKIYPIILTNSYTERIKTTAPRYKYLIRRIQKQQSFYLTCSAFAYTEEYFANVFSTFTW